MDLLLRWYTSEARAFLLEHVPAKVAELDEDQVRVQALATDLSQPLPVCLLGASGVGKSTLINALVAGSQVILPSGGIGPLTALALEVRYGPPAFTAQYQKRGDLSRLLFALEQTHIRRSGKVPATAVEAEHVDVEQALAADPSEDTETYDSLRKQAQILITGSQHREDSLDYLIDRLREVLGRAPAWSTTVRDSDLDRISRLRQALSIANEDRRYERAEADDRRGFVQELQEHASGFLAPLIRNLVVYWDAPLLRDGTLLVDLPGIGIAGDVYREVTQQWIRERARAVVLVVNHRGIGEADADLLRSSGFLTRLLFSVDDPQADPVVLAVAVTQLDLIAESRYDADKSRRKYDYIAEAFVEATDLLRSQLRGQLANAWSGGPDPLSEGRQSVVERLSESVQIYPASALQFRRLLASDPDNLAFIRAPEESGIPQLQAALTVISREWKTQNQARLDDALATFCERGLSTIRLIEAEWQSEGRATDEAQQLRSELATFIEPLRREFDTRKGSFREFLRTGVPTTIDSLVAEASASSSKSIRAYLRRLKDAHWATLKAAVVRGGAFQGSRRINLPDDFSQEFVEPIAEIWGARLLRDIRSRTSDFAGDCVGQVEEIVDWCRESGVRVAPKLLEAQLDAIKADARQISVVGKEAVAELRTEVKNTLTEEIRKPIKRRCDEFVAKGDAAGRGVKNRILDLFEDLADSSTSDAERVAKKVLTRNFKKVEEELRTVMVRFENPLDAAVEAIVSSTESRLRRSDAQKRGAVLSVARALIASCPCGDDLSVAQSSG